MPDVEKIQKFIRLVAEKIFYDSLGMLIISRRYLVVEFKDRYFELYQEVAKFGDYRINNKLFLPLRQEYHSDYYVSYAECRVYEIHRFPYPRKNIEEFIIKKIIEHL